MSTRKSFFALGGLALIAFAATASVAAIESGESGDRVETLAVCDSGLASFRAEVHPFLRDRCASCHDAGGDGPGHSVADPQAAYSVFRKFVDAGDFEHSRVMEYVRGKHWLDYDAASRGAEPAEMLARMNAWWAGGESECPGAAVFVTDAIDLPALLPTLQEGKYVGMRWSLSRLGPEFASAFFELEIQRFSSPQAENPGAYRVRKPRVVSPLKPLSLGGIRLVVSDRINSTESAYSFVNQVVNPVAGMAGDDAGYPVLSAQEMIVLQRQTTRVDRLSVSFEKLSRAPALNGCRSLAVFENRVRPLLSQSCLQCHGAAGDAQKRYPMLSGERGDQACARALERADRGLPEASALLALPVSRAQEHPAVFSNPQLTRQFKREVTDWIRSEGAL